MTLGVPVKVLHEAEGHTVTVESATGELYRGVLIEAEDNMNMQVQNFAQPPKLSFAETQIKWLKFWSICFVNSSGESVQIIEHLNFAENGWLKRSLKREAKLRVKISQI